MSIGFKEWALVCRALEEGKSSLILRKGGIAEGRDGFRFKHDEFFLFPTLFHEQAEKTTLPEGISLPENQTGMITIRARATVEWTRLITDPVLLEKLAAFHILHPSVVDERFHYDSEEGNEGLHVAFLRVNKLSAPWIFPDSPKYGGCRSWLELPELPEGITWSPVLNTASHDALNQKLQETLGMA